MAIDLNISDIALGGKGVGRHNGKALFVPYVIDGENVSVRVTREHRKLSEAELDAVQTKSPHRVEPRCPYFGRCGGCVYQHIDYAHQLAIKSRQVEQTLARIGRIAKPPMRAIIPSPCSYEYRNRITVHVREGVIGFFQRESNALLDIEFCPISSKEVNARLRQLRAARPLDGHYSVREAGGPRIFTQANTPVANAMLELVDHLLQSSHGALVDAYCGAGFFAKKVRTRFDQVIGIDWDRHAIAAARSSAWANEEYVAGDVEAELNQRLQTSPCDALIVDPPATGLCSRVRSAINKLTPPRLIYVSCNPATLARDLRELAQSFKVDSITPLDMFPQTAEIEVVAELSRTP